MTNFNPNQVFRLLDCVAILVACSISYWLRFGTAVLPLAYLLPTVILILFGSLSLSASQHYRFRRNTANRKIGTAFFGMFFATMCTSLFMYLTKSGEDYSRIWLLLSLSISFVLIVIMHIVVTNFISKTAGQKNVLLVGSNGTAEAIKNRLHGPKTPWLNLSSQLYDLNDGGKRALSLLEKFRLEGKNSAVSEVWITHDVFSTIEPSKLSLVFAEAPVTLAFVPEMPSAGFLMEQEIDYVAGFPMVESGLSDLKRINNSLKTIEDFVLSFLGLVLLTPLLLIIASAIKMDSSGPVLFHQTRHGANGKKFKIIKFRTMHVMEDGEHFVQATSRDSRVTNVGRFLRRTSLDELPQLINVLNGTMSLVGPRPHPTKLDNEFVGKVDQLMKRNRVKPGITGLAQINGARGETDTIEKMEARIKYDLEYVRTWSLGLDIKILARTLFHVIEHAIK